MINQRIFFNVIDENQRPIPGCKVRIENKNDKYEANTDFCGIVEFLVPLGVYVLTLEHSYFKKKVFRMRLRDGFSFTRISLQENGYAYGVSNRNINERTVNRMNNMRKEEKLRFNDEIEKENSIEYSKDSTFKHNEGVKNEHKGDSLNSIKNIVENLNNQIEVNCKEIYDNENTIINKENNSNENFIKTGVFEGNGFFGASGVFEGISDTTFNEILNGAKGILQDILEFANSVDFENSQYTDREEDFNDCYEEESQGQDKINCDGEISKEIENNNEWEPEEIIREKFGVQHGGETYDIYDYEEEIFEPISDSQEQ